MEEEIWLPVVGYEGLYEVSHFGRVKSFCKCVDGKIAVQGVRLKYKYRTVTLCKNNVRQSFYVHSLVLEHFNCERPYGLECLHNDGNHENNYIGNLSWGTHKENVQDALRHGTFNLMVGENHVCAKLKPHDIIEIRKLLLEGIFQKDIAKKYGVRQQQVSRINTNKHWAHLK